MLYATGFRDEDMDKAQVGIASVWYEGNPCNMHLNTLAAHVKQGVVRAGMVGMRFNTIGVSDGISMGTDGMSFSLQSRDLIADSIETSWAPVVRRLYRPARLRQEHARLPDRDGPLEPAVADGLRRHDPSRDSWASANWTSFRRFNAMASIVAGTIDDETRRQIVSNACPGAGACGGMYTANTMASAIEALGMSLPYSSSIPAEDPAKIDECLRGRPGHPHLLEQDIKPRDIMTRAPLKTPWSS